MGERKCRNCGITYKSHTGKKGGFCNSSCKIINFKKYKAESKRLQRELYRKYFK